jgi:hypothetical protein
VVDRCWTQIELDIIELGPLVAYYWRACRRWPMLTLHAAFEIAEYERGMSE